jgi:hypothetical protein
MLKVKYLGISLVLLTGTVVVAAQTMGRPEEFNAVAIVNNNLGSGADRVIVRVDRWSTEAERTRLTAALQKGSDALLDAGLLTHLATISAMPIRSPGKTAAGGL